MRKALAKYMTISYMCIWGAWLGFLVVAMLHYFLSLPAIDWFSISLGLAKITYIMIIINTCIVLFDFIKRWFFD